MKLDELIAHLGKLKGSGDWQRLAASSGVNYFTIARIYRGEIPNPGVRIVERLVDAIEKAAPAPTEHAPTPAAPARKKSEAPTAAPTFEQGSANYLRLLMKRQQRTKREGPGRD
jgi:hypothetical protein